MDFWLRAWHFIPSVVVGCVAIAVLYLYAIGPLRKQYELGPSVPRSRVVVFLLGVLIILLALVSPLDELGDDYLFSAHMVQHLLITLVAPPMMLWGLPGWLLMPLLRNRLLYRTIRFLTLPIVAFFLFNADIFLWHAPPLYDATLENEGIHVLEHLTFIIFSFLFWWPVLSPLEGELGPLPLPGQVLYLFLSGMPMVLLGAGLTFVPPLYAPYLAAPRIWGISPATDQQLGGLIMWVPANILVIVLMSVLFIRWMLAQEQRQIERERLAWQHEEEQERARQARQQSQQGDGDSEADSWPRTLRHETSVALPPSSGGEHPGEQPS
ncbi:cytochrome c oxidase assembly protein [Thermogemmatispora sp.]|uniref:cytochrome c oxidase assembly protein n=1 Tax=Thermogemmatispora sp. TaxID=1968838 RepID=UPI001D9AC169|nr:cytochrome c oxidase assembly protein [Thermogemmatispora sp.]MBX5451268.1 cytochrome c oxidase assembly protein [Thermogemmatispora sp.]